MLARLRGSQRLSRVPTEEPASGCGTKGRTPLRTCGEPLPCASCVEGEMPSEPEPAARYRRPSLCEVVQVCLVLQALFLIIIAVLMPTDDDAARTASGGWDDPFAKDGWTLSGWLLTSFEVRTGHWGMGLGSMTCAMSCKARRNAA